MKVPIAQPTLALFVTFEAIIHRRAARVPPSDNISQVGKTVWMPEKEHMGYRIR
jgi:hypothetical protein